MLMTSVAYTVQRIDVIVMFDCHMLSRCGGAAAAIRVCFVLLSLPARC